MLIKQLALEGSPEKHLPLQTKALVNNLVAQCVCSPRTIRCYRDSRMPSQPEPQAASFIVTTDDVKLAIRSFKNSSGGGPDGLIPHHLKGQTSDQIRPTGINLLG